MATIDIGKIKPVFKGTYDNSVSYVLDDIVYYNGSSYVAKTSTTGNLPTDTTKWNILASGSGGIWNSSLSLGTAGQVVKVNSGASALEFGTLSSDYVKIGTYSANNVASLVIDNIFSTTYSTYKIFIDRFYGASNGAWLGLRTVSSGTTESGNVYATIQGYAYVESSTQGYASGNSGWHSSSNQGYLMLGSSDASYRGSAEVTFYNPGNSDSDADRDRINFKTAGWNGTGRFETRDGAFWVNNTSAPTGVEFRYSGNNFYGKFRVYGIK